ncbi:anti-sigma factor family protein [Pedococcus sp. 5OH_020]|uniref:anti-sigma factor family protein n=1 Tax=Pedococcus sp. 5OH_020 TaxID=2989814 RepID=UPI0022E9FFD5|nr:zf-HC2 domain-containing protein [Pedococcus sp. 5OH_020]
MNGTDSYTQWDAAYVLGTLSPAERVEFEAHLATCPDCRTAVAELAGMPGLLAQVPTGEVLAMDLGGPEEDAAMLTPPPRSLMPVLPTPSASRRRRWLVPLAAAAAALVVGGLGGYAVSAAGHDGGPSPRPTATATAAAVPGRLAFTSVEPSSMTAVLDLVPAGSGTQLRVECQYAVGSGRPGDPDYQGAWAEYSIWVVDRAGKATQVKTWTARPDRVMHPSGVAPVPVGQIGVVEIRRVDTGRTVMRATVA